MARIAVIPGDGIGPEVIREALKVGQEVAARFDLELQFETVRLDADTYLSTGTALPPETFERLRDEFDAILLGALGDERVPDMAHLRGVLLGLRSGLDLFVNLRPVKLLHEDLCPLKGRGCDAVCFEIVRENTEGAYCGLGGTLRRGTEAEIAIEQDVNTRRGVERILRFAFERAGSWPRRRLCMADKSNILVHGHGLWKRVFDSLREEYPQIRARHLYIDALVMEMVRDPSQFEVIVTCNLFGDIVSDLGAQLQGGMGMAASANTCPDSGAGLFEPVHGSAPGLVGGGLANPMATILSLSMLLAHLGHEMAAAQVEAAVVATLEGGRCTPDVGGTATTAQVGDEVAVRVGSTVVT